MSRFIFSFLCMFAPAWAWAQFSYVLDQEVRVENAAGQPLTSPWAGGINAAQFNTMDLNGDGVDDLVLFDRMANKVLTFLAENNRWAYRPEYEAFFPDVSNFVLLRDYNCDGKKDLFTGDLLGIRVYTNKTATPGYLTWEHYLFTPPSGEKKPVILTYGSNPNLKINLQIQYDDLPALVDADGDGDLDIFNVQYMGSSVEYHQNFSVENGWGCDSLEFRRMTNRWGNFSECSCGVIALNGEPCSSSASRTQHAGGKALLALDANGDQKMDLLFSEADCDHLALLVNEGTLLEPVINTYTAFPQPAPATYNTFPAGFLEDVDFDGVKDFISAPNIFVREDPHTDLRSSSWLFRNEGTDANPSFQFVQNNFLQDEMIDVGDNAVPAFVDYDGDGDLDLFVSAYSDPASTDLRSAVHYFENIGTPSGPAFRLVDDDYPLFNASSLYNLKIRFADVTGDGAPDLLFTASLSNNDDRTNNDPTRLYFVPNAGRGGVDLEGQPLYEVAFALLSVENVSFADINGDGRADILLGRNDGAIEYWRNAGGTPVPSFVLEQSPFAGLGPDFYRQNAVCLVADLNGDGREDFAYTETSGHVSIISDFRASLESPHATELVFNPLLRQRASYNFGGQSWPVVANLFQTNRPAVVVGNLLGGLYFLKPHGGFGLFPNPVSGGQMTIETEAPATVFIYAASGQLVGGPVTVAESADYDVSHLAPGFYILRFVTATRTFTQKVVIR